MGICLLNLKSESLTTLEQLAFNAQQIRGSRDPGHASFRKKIIRGYFWTVPSNMFVEI